MPYTDGMDFMRDYPMYAFIFGFFGFGWFGWAQENPPESWRKYLGMASGMSLLVAAIGAYLAFTDWNAASALDSDGAYTRYGIIVGIEFLAAAIGATILMLRKRAKLVASWIAFVVGVHFIPLAHVFQDTFLVVLAVLMVLASQAPRLIKTTRIAPNTLVCVATASILFVFGMRGLLLYWLASS